MSTSYGTKRASMYMWAQFRFSVGRVIQILNGAPVGSLWNRPQGLIRGNPTQVHCGLGHDGPSGSFANVAQYRSTMSYLCCGFAQCSLQTLYFWGCWGDFAACVFC